MDAYFDRTLVADFPVLYGQRYGDMRWTCMVWGFECGNGWEPLIRDLSQQLEWLNENTNLWVEALQVKEKYGTLRFYVTYRAGDGPWADIADALIDCAEMRSEFTCEACGGIGVTRHDGWVRTLCDACEEKRLQAGGGIP